MKEHLEESGLLDSSDQLQSTWSRGYPDVSIQAVVSMDPSSENGRQKPPKLLMAANVGGFFKKFLLPYASHFRSLGWQVDAMSKSFDHVPDIQWDQYFDNVHEVDWARKPQNLRGSKNIVHRIREIAEEGEYDLIHVHTPVAAMMTRYAMRYPAHRRHCQVIYTAHGFHFFEGASPVTGKVFKKLESIASRWTDYLVVMNDEDLNAAKLLGMVPESRLRYMPGIGVDLEKFGLHPKKSAEIGAMTRLELGIGSNEILFSCIAEFIPRKRQHDILLALARSSHKGFKVAFAGVGETWSMVKESAKKLGLTDQILFLGNRDDIANLIHASQATILPSCQEGLPRSVMESMAGGTPVIATDVRGSRDLLKTGGGILYPVGDIPALLSAMEKIANDPEGARSMGHRGMQTVREYDFNKVVRLHEELYADALGRGAKSRAELRSPGSLVSSSESV